MSILSPVLNQTSDIDEVTSPPLVPGMTNVDPRLFGLGGNDDDEQAASPSELLGQVGELFAKLAEMDPLLLMTALEMGGAIAKAIVHSGALQNQNQFQVPVNAQTVPPMPQGVPLNPAAAMQSPQIPQPGPAPMQGGIPQMQPPQTPF